MSLTHEQIKTQSWLLNVHRHHTIVKSKYHKSNIVKQGASVFHQLCAKLFVFKLITKMKCRSNKPACTWWQERSLTPLSRTFCAHHDLDNKRQKYETAKQKHWGSEPSTHAGKTIKTHSQPTYDNVAPKHNYCPAALSARLRPVASYLRGSLSRNPRQRHSGLLWPVCSEQAVWGVQWHLRMLPVED